MKDTIDTMFAWLVIGGIALSGFVAGYLTADNHHLRGDVKIMTKMMELSNMISEVESKHKNDEETEDTEEEVES